MLASQSKNRSRVELELSGSESPRQKLQHEFPIRTALTAQGRRRPSNSPSASKTITLKPHEGGSLGHRGLYAEPLQLLPMSSGGLLVSGGLSGPSQFDHLQLQDFLKQVLVGESKVAEDKSQEIIRSLNGTWFKDTRSTEMPSHKLYNSLGIRRTCIQTRQKQSKPEHSPHFLREYTPPNIFPPKKVARALHSSKSRDLQGGRSMVEPSKSLLGDLTSWRPSQESPLKASILRRMPRSSEKPFRSVSHIERRKSQVFPAKRQDAGFAEGLVKGHRMVLHKD